MQSVHAALMELELNAREAQSIQHIFSNIAEIGLKPLITKGMQNSHGDSCINIIPSTHKTTIKPVVVCLARGLHRRSPTSLPRVLEQLRVHLIHGFAVTTTVILVTDAWSQQAAGSTLRDLSAHSARGVLFRAFLAGDQIMPISLPLR